MDEGGHGERGLDYVGIDVKIVCLSVSALVDLRLQHRCGGLTGRHRFERAKEDRGHP